MILVLLDTGEKQYKILTSIQTLIKIIIFHLFNQYTRTLRASKS